MPKTIKDVYTRSAKIAGKTVVLVKGDQLLEACGDTASDEIKKKVTDAKGRPVAITGDDLLAAMNAAPDQPKPKAKPPATRPPAK